MWVGWVGLCVCCIFRICMREREGGWLGWWVVGWVAGWVGRCGYGCWRLCVCVGGWVGHYMCVLLWRCVRVFVDVEVFPLFLYVYPLFWDFIVFSSKRDGRDVVLFTHSFFTESFFRSFFVEKHRFPPFLSISPPLSSLTVLLPAAMPLQSRCPLGLHWHEAP